jgi:integrase
MARVRKHRSKWQVLARDPATRREVSEGAFTRKEDADRRRKIVEYQQEMGEWVNPASRKTPYAEWAHTWLSTRSHLKPKTLDGYRSLLDSRVLPRFGGTRLCDIRAIEIDRWISDLVAEGLSPSRIRQAFTVLSSSLKAAVRSRMIASNPADGTNLPRMPHREMPFLTPEELHRLAASVPDLYRAFILTLGYGGLRAGEAIALRRRSVNVLRSEITVAESATEVNGKLVFGETKNRRRRIVTAPAFLRDILNDHLLAYVGPAPDDLVFTSPDGCPLRLSNFRVRVWRQALIAAELEPSLRIHDLRHTSASLLISRGAHPKVVQEHLGHSSIAVTMDRYGHIYPSERQRIAGELDALFREHTADGWEPTFGSDADQMRTNEPMLS